MAQMDLNNITGDPFALITISIAIVCAFLHPLILPSQLVQGYVSDLEYDLR